MMKFFIIMPKFFQMPVEEQVAIALYRFGHYGNSASTMKIALHFGVGNIQRDSFYAKGKKYQKKMKKLERRWKQECRRRAAQEENELDTQEDIELLEGKIKREELKEELLVYHRQLFSFS